MSTPDSFRQNVLFAVSSNLLIALVSALSTLVIPKLLGVEEYGYWQLFVFYGSYALLLQCGIGDGANLRYAGLQVHVLASRAIGAQAIAVTAVTSTGAVIAAILAPHIFEDPTRATILQATSIFAIVVNVRHFLLMQMQSISDFRSYSRTTIFDRLMFSGIVIVALSLGVRDYWAFAGIEILSKAASLGVALVASRHFIATRWSDHRLAFQELRRNIVAGLKLTIANTSNMLILGAARFLIDRAFGIVTFGAISLVLNLSSLFMIFINAVGHVLFPTLRRARQERLADLYVSARLGLSLLPLSLLILAFPITRILNSWLPEYAIGLQYFVLLMPIIAFESRMGLLVTPFLKTVRKENLLLVVNLGALLVSTLLSVLSTIVLGSLDLAAGSILIALALRAVVAELVLLRSMNLPIVASSVVETVLALASAVLQLMLGGWAATLIIGILVGGYALAFRRPLADSYREILRLLRG